jgi:fatty acid CoA ligase FadD9
VLALLDAYRMPQVPVSGGLAPTARFRKAVQISGVGDQGDIPHLDLELIRKYLTDLKRLGLV